MKSRRVVSLVLTLLAVVSIGVLGALIIARLSGCF